ncbi:hypothetical protein [Leptolyngbya sp. CCNP1308]|uniref:hypothetical protein n=1 Tax=Leptolyngbya sp. CCNP1308 TaxID=3110255 RepID=UPI002B200A1D|nr:hypothetical protein [Leptolyngbya sp. CCNP1308]
MKVIDRRNTESTESIGVKVIDNSQEAPSYQWLEATASNVPSNAFVAAEEFTSEIEGNRLLFLCRAEISGRKVPGKVVKGLCNIPSYKVEDGEIKEPEEKLARDYEILVSEREISWERPSSNSENVNGLPEGTLMSDDRFLTVICRTNYSQEVPDSKDQETGSGDHPGILEPSLGLCLFPWGGTVKSSSNYEILIAK